MPALSPPQLEYIEQQVAALRCEIAAQRENGGTPVAIEDGSRIHEDPLGATYRFTLRFEAVVPEGIPIQLQVGRERWEAELVMRDGLSILLLVSRSNETGRLPERSLDQAELLADPWFLLEQLRQHLLATIDEGSVSRPAARLLDRMLKPGSSALPSGTDGESIDGLNPEQSSAVANACEHELWFVWGPPGTGKTSTLGHLVDRLVHQNESVLMCAHSNVAVDAALLSARAALERSPQGRKLLASGRVLRAGPPALAAAVDSGLSSRERVLAENPGLASRLRSAERAITAAARAGRSTELRAAVAQLRTIRTEIKKLEQELIGRASVLFSTFSKAAGTPAIVERRFSAVIVDEVSMAIPAQVLQAATLSVARLSVFGDFKQLPPIVTAADPSAQRLLGTDVFTACGVDAAATRDDAPGITMLREQYRMHPDIRQIVSDFSYSGRLRDGERLHRALTIADADPFAGAAVSWINTALHGAVSSSTRTSRFNVQSALWSIRMAIELNAAVGSVVLLAPYRAQARLLAAFLRESGLTDIQLGTIHRFQGSEAASVIVDLVDGPPIGRPGRPFLGMAGERLLNVGLSRAIGKLVVLGHTTLARHDALTPRVRSLLSDLRAHEVRPEPDWQWNGDDASIRCWSKVPKALNNLPASSVVAGWFPVATGPIERLRVPQASTGPDRQTILVTDEGVTWLANARPHGGHEVWRVASPRFANEVSTLMSGAAITQHRSGGDSMGSVARFDRCASCGKGSRLVLRGRGFVALECDECSASRWPTTNELTAWAVAVGLRCPECDEGLLGKQGARRPFLSCASYPKCKGKQWVDALPERAVLPELERRPVVSSQPKRRRKQAPSVSREALARRQALDNYIDYGFSESEGEVWLEAGVAPQLAVQLKEMGIGASEALRMRRRSGQQDGGSE